MRHFFLRFVAKKYEGYGGDAKYYDSNNKDSYDRYDRYDKYDNKNASKFRSDNDVKEKHKEVRFLFIKYIFILFSFII